MSSTTHIIGDLTITGTVDGRDIAADGTTLDDLPVSNLANGTDGELITWDAAGAPTTVAVGTSGQVLTSNGAGAAPTFQNAGAGSGALVHLTGGDHSGASSFDVDISSYTSTYDVFKIVMTNGDVVTDSDYIGLQLFTDGGTTPISSGYAYATEGNDDAGSDHGDNSGNDSQMKITDSCGNDAGQMWSAEFNLYNCSSSAEVKTIGGQSSFFDGGIDWTVYNFTGALPGTTAVITDFRILSVGGPGNFSCRYDVYGLAQS